MSSPVGSSPMPGNKRTHHVMEGASAHQQGGDKHRRRDDLHQYTTARGGFNQSENLKTTQSNSNNPQYSNTSPSPLPCVDLNMQAPNYTVTLEPPRAEVRPSRSVSKPKTNAKAFRSAFGEEKVHCVAPVSQQEWSIPFAQPAASTDVTPPNTYVKTGRNSRCMFFMK